MKIDLKWLNKNGACESGIAWFQSQKKSEGIDVIKSLMEQDHFDWANWTIVRLMTHEQKISYAIFAAEQVLGIYEKKYPDDKRPRWAIESAKGYLKNPSEKNKNAAYAAADAAGDAAAYASADRAAYAAAYAAARAAGDAAADASAARAAYAAADAAARAAAYAAGDAAAYTAGDAAMKKRIIENGIKMLKSKKG